MITVSGGQAGGTIWVSPFKRGGDIEGSHAFDDHNTSLSEGRASPLWSETFTKRRIRRGRTSIYRVGYEHARRG